MKWISWSKRKVRNLVCASPPLCWPQVIQDVDTLCHSGFLINYWFMFALGVLGLSPYPAGLGSGLRFPHRCGTVLPALSCSVPRGHLHGWCGRIALWSWVPQSQIPAGNSSWCGVEEKKKSCIHSLQSFSPVRDVVEDGVRTRSDGGV